MEADALARPLSRDLFFFVIAASHALFSVPARLFPQARAENQSMASGNALSSGLTHMAVRWLTAQSAVSFFILRGGRRVGA